MKLAHQLIAFGMPFVGLAVLYCLARFTVWRTSTPKHPGVQSYTIKTSDISWHFGKR
jgi:hypothetical protein